MRWTTGPFVVRQEAVASTTRRHFTREERYPIGNAKSTGLSVPAIAAEIGLGASSAGREQRLQGRLVLLADERTTG